MLQQLILLLTFFTLTALLVLMTLTTAALIRALGETLGRSS